MAVKSARGQGCVAPAARDLRHGAMAATFATARTISIGEAPVDRGGVIEGSGENEINSSLFYAIMYPQM